MNIKITILVVIAVLLMAISSLVTGILAVIVLAIASILDKIEVKIKSFINK